MHFSNDSNDFLNLSSTPSSYDYRIHRPIIYSIMALLTIAGIFGNLNIILVHLRYPLLRTKYGIMLCTLSICQTICLCFEWTGITVTLTVPILHRSTCYYVEFLFVLVYCLQSGILTSISADLLISIIFPMKHRNAHVFPYVFIICLPGALVGVICDILGYLYLDDAIIPMCNPPATLNKISNQIFYLAALIDAGIVIFNYSLAYLIIAIKSRNNRDPLEIELRALRSLSLLLLVFVFSRFFGLTISNLLIIIRADPALISLYQSYNGIFAVLVYSQNFYVTYMKSSDYRKLLKEQLELLGFGRIRRKIASASQISPSPATQST